MRSAFSLAAIAALTTSVIAQDSQQTWDDAEGATSTITKTLSIVHTETVWGQSSSATAEAAVESSSPVSKVAESSSEKISSETSVAAEQTSAVASEPSEPSAAPIATPSDSISGAAGLSFDVVLAVVAAGAVTFWSS